MVNVDRKKKMKRWGRTREENLGGKWERGQKT
jgi:hypothetical protein